MRHVRPLTLGALAFCILVGLGRSAWAGPLLICHPFATGGAESLPWSAAPTWNAPDTGYDSRQLVSDVVRLLAATPSVLARMETMRRATIYAARDAKLASDLLTAVQSRAAGSRATGAWPAAAFDAGYLIETYRQASQIYRWDMLSREARDIWAIRRAPTADGYAMMRTALDQIADGEMEFAASLVAPGTAADTHRRRALAAARPGSALAAVIRAVDAER